MKRAKATRSRARSAGACRSAEIMNTLRTLGALLLALHVAGIFAAVEVADLVAELQHSRSKTKDGVISMDESAFKRYGSGKGRPYSLIVFLTAKQVLDNPHLQMEALRKEFGYASKAVWAGPEPDSAYFAEIVFEDAPKVFHAMQVTQVPFIFRVPGNRKVVLTSEFKIPDGDKMTFQTMGGSAKYPWQAEAMLSFFKRSGLVAGEVDRPSIFKHPMFPFMVLSALVGVVVVLRLLWRLGVMHHPLPYAVVALAVFWFSVSGGMYNIIRGMPLFTRDKNGRIQFFLGSRGAQLGAEGFIVGSGYILFSSAVSLLTFAVPRVKFTPARNVLSYLLVAATAYLAFQLFGVFAAKNNYRISTYLLRQ